MDCSKPGFPSPTPGACSNLCPSSQRCHPTISSSVALFSSCLQSFPASGSFPVSQFFTSGGESIGASASASVFPMNIQCWLHLGLTGLISFQSKSLLQHHNSEASILQHSAFFMVQMFSKLKTFSSAIQFETSLMSLSLEEWAAWALFLIWWRLLDGLITMYKNAQINIWK